MNRLAQERSPYLLQHASNPVDWYPWGKDAFERARVEDKPIFLSIGYSTCHWCHVMEHESFENAEIADLLNRDYISIKVDREERPDVDRVYMSFVQSTTGAGGWPMTVFLTPDLKPFYGGTYFPPASRWGRPGFADLLGELSRVWKDDRPRVEQAAVELLDRLKLVTGASRPQRADVTIAGPEALDQALEQYQTAFDRRHGGFGDAPKFPRPSEQLFLLREHARRAAGGSGTAEAPLRLATESLRAMAMGGMRDHVGGGFHRYSVDAEWRVPHFEKMLYDQAQLVLAFLEASQATGDDFFATVAEDTLEYVMRDLTDPRGGFYSAEDADSVPADRAGEPHPHKSEGAFYIWTDREIRELVGEDTAIAQRRFGIESNGNALQDPQGEFTGQNILYIAQSIEDVAIRSDRTSEEVVAVLGRVREVLFNARAKRPRPHLDDKVLTAWNGLMIAAFARAARVLTGRPAAARYLTAARRAAEFIRATLWDANRKRLLRRYRDGEAAIAAYAEDYAYLILGLLELFQADGNPTWLEWALALQERQDALFWDEAGGAWFSTDGADPTVLLRLKEEYDGAEPAPSSVAVLNMIALSQLVSQGAPMLAKAERTLSRFGSRIGAAARVVPMMLAGLSAWHADRTEIVVVGPRGRKDSEALLSTVGAHYRPFAMVIPVDPDAGDARPPLSSLMPAAAAMTMRGGVATAYVCRAFACREPVTEPAALTAQM